MYISARRRCASRLRIFPYLDNRGRHEKHVHRVLKEDVSISTCQPLSLEDPKLAWVYLKTFKQHTRDTHDETSAKPAEQIREKYDREK